VVDKARAEIETANKERESETLNTEQPEQLPAPNGGSHTILALLLDSRVLFGLGLLLALVALLLLLAAAGF
jgi:hypothetical protein